MEKAEIWRTTWSTLFLTPSSSCKDWRWILWKENSNFSQNARVSCVNPCVRNILRSQYTVHTAPIIKQSVSAALVARAGCHFWGKFTSIASGIVHFKLNRIEEPSGGKDRNQARLDPDSKQSVGWMIPYSIHLLSVLHRHACGPQTWTSSLPVITRNLGWSSENFS